VGVRVGSLVATSTIGAGVGRVLFSTIFEGSGSGLGLDSGSGREAVTIGVG